MSNVAVSTSPGPTKRKFPLILKLLLGIILVVVVAVVAFAIVVALQPTKFHVERSAEISAPSDVVFAQINEFDNWEAWSPWAKLDPNVKNTFEGPSSGKGAIFKWSGNDEVGEGQMEILESRPNELIRIKLDFIRPFASTSTVEFTFKADGDRTKVTWSMFGDNNFLSKAFCLFMDMDKMIGGDFEKGLTQIKAISEEKAKE